MNTLAVFKATFFMTIPC